MTVFLHIIPDSLHVPWSKAAPIYEDNADTTAIDNSSRPTRRTRHVELKHFALLDWTETNQVILSFISFTDHSTYGLIKVLGPHTFA